jgi:hypothetical protein
MLYSQTGQRPKYNMALVLCILDLSLSLSLTRTRARTHTHTHTHTISLSLSLSLSLFLSRYTGESDGVQNLSHPWYNRHTALKDNATKGHMVLL